MPSASGSSVSAPGLSRSAMSALESASELMVSMGDTYVSTDHLLYGIAKVAGRSLGLDEELMPSAVGAGIGGAP